MRFDSRFAIMPGMRFRPRFSLRTLFVALTVTCVLLSSGLLWFRIQQAAYRRQSKIAERIEKLNGSVRWESDTPASLKWIGEIEACKHIASVSSGFQEPVMAVAIAKELNELPTVRCFNVFEHQVTDEFLVCLAENKNAMDLQVNMGLISHSLPDNQRFAYLERRSQEIQRCLPKSIKVLWDGSYNGPP